MRTSSQLRQLLSDPGMVVAPFAYDALQARLVERAGFPAVYMTGFGTAAARGYPDVGLLTMSEMVANAKYMASAVAIPLICDADTGYGNPISVWRTVQEYEAAGAAAIHIEDQVWPKKCGFFQGKRVIPRQEMVQKVRAAVDARRDKDFVVIARTDALAVNGWHDALERAQAYYGAGADLVFVDGIHTLEELEAYAKALPGVPKMYNGQLLPTHELQRMGFKINIVMSTFVVVVHALRDALSELKTSGAVGIAGSPHDPEITELLGLPRIYEMERKYAAEDNAP
ncbi:MAG: oxaloacetate decarboxylase [Dehalococcoidia bacterium]